MAVAHLDHFNNGVNGAATKAVSGTLGATRTNCLIMACITTEPNSASDIHVTSITDNAGTGLVWTQYCEHHGNTTGGGDPATFFRAEVWWAYGSLPSTSLTVTVNTNINADNMVVAIHTFSGVNSTQPFDQHSGLPVKYFATANATPTVSVSTDTSNTMIIGYQATPTGQTQNTTTYGGVAADWENSDNFSNGANWAKADVSGKAFSSPQTSKALACSASRTNQMMIGFALTADSQGVPPSGTITTSLTKPSTALAGSVVNPTSGAITTALTKPSTALAGSVANPAINGTITTALTKPSTAIVGEYLPPHPPVVQTVVIVMGR